MAIVIATTEDIAISLIEISTDIIFLGCTLDHITIIFTEAIETTYTFIGSFILRLITMVTGTSVDTRTLFTTDIETDTQAMTIVLTS
jgi:hypothetical protein